MVLEQLPRSSAAVKAQSSRKMRRAHRGGIEVEIDGVVYVFRAKRADRIKLLYWDGSGVVLMAKTLEQGVFCWPRIQDGAMRLSASQLSTLLDGMDWARVYRAARTRAPITAD